jgi:hypothetical protein
MVDTDGAKLSCILQEKQKSKTVSSIGIKTLSTCGNNRAYLLMQPTAFHHGHFNCLHLQHLRVHFNVLTRTCSHGFLKMKTRKRCSVRLNNYYRLLWLWCIHITEAHSCECSNCIHFELFLTTNVQHVICEASITVLGVFIFFN